MSVLHSHQYIHSPSYHPHLCKKWIHTAKLFVLTESPQMLILFIEDVMILKSG